MADEDGLAGFALWYPFGRGAGLFLKGTLVSILSYFILPLFLLFGYWLRVAAATAEGETRTEPLTDFLTLFKEGLKGFVVLLPAFLVPFLGAVISYLPGRTLRTVLATLLIVGYMYSLPAVVVRYAVTRDWRETYRAGWIYETVFDMRYLRYFLVFVGLYIFLGIVVAVALFPVLTFLIGAGGGGPALAVVLALVYLVIGPAIHFYSYTLVAAYWGSVYGKM